MAASGHTTNNDDLNARCLSEFLENPGEIRSPCTSDWTVHVHLHGVLFVGHGSRTVYVLGRVLPFGGKKSMDKRLECLRHVLTHLPMCF